MGTLDELVLCVSVDFSLCNFDASFFALVLLILHEDLQYTLCCLVVFVIKLCYSVIKLCHFFIIKTYLLLERELV